MYPLVLLVHSLLRYPVLILGALLLGLTIVRLRGDGSWSQGLERLAKGFMGLLDTQFLLGLLLFLWLSPLSTSAFQDMGGAMKEPTLRFFGLEHPVTMILAVAAAHIGRSRSRKREGAARLRTIVWGQAIWLLLTLAAIPWPMLDVGRPLFRP